MKKGLLLLFIAAFLYNNIYACTTGIISGKYTIDGRPLLFKHRDTESLENKLKYFSEGKYKFVGVINSNDIDGKNVWMGTNEAGFSIMNSASYNLNNEDEPKDREGIIIKMALEQCKTVNDFENMLKNLPKPLGVEANFGVIDAAGNGAYFETSNYSFTKFDVNDKKVAPNGYLIRTNYSFTGEKDKGYGYIRYLTANELLYEAGATNNLSYKFILQNISRSLKHTLLDTDLALDFPKNDSKINYVITEDFIPRYSSASAFVCRGVKEGESPDMTTMFVILGYPLTSVTIPVWVVAGDFLPQISTADGVDNSLICKIALKLKKFVYPIDRANGHSYMNITALYNKSNQGIYQKLLPIENNILSKCNSLFNQWEKTGFAKEEALDFYRWLDKFVIESLDKEFGFNYKVIY